MMVFGCYLLSTERCEWCDGPVYCGRHYKGPNHCDRRHACGNTRTISSHIFSCILYLDSGLVCLVVVGLGSSVACAAVSGLWIARAELASRVATTPVTYFFFLSCVTKFCLTIGAWYLALWWLVQKCAWTIVYLVFLKVDVDQRVHVYTHCGQNQQMDIIDQKPHSRPSHWRDCGQHHAPICISNRRSQIDSNSSYPTLHRYATFLFRIWRQSHDTTGLGFGHKSGCGTTTRHSEATPGNCKYCVNETETENQQSKPGVLFRSDSHETIPVTNIIFWFHFS